jgi:hypothetical protein
MRSLVCGLSLCLLAAAFAADRPALPPGPGPVIPDAARNPAWSLLLSRLAPQRARQSQFTERRFFPFRSAPVVLTGVVRIDPQRGLSLAYLTPDVRTLIIDAQGALLRDDRGRSRAMPADSRVQAATMALVSVLRFDLADLQRHFVLRGQRLDSAWQLTLEPKDPALAPGLSTLLVAGTGERLDRIDLIKSASQRIEITLRDTDDGAIFPPAALARYFR